MNYFGTIRIMHAHYKRWAILDNYYNTLIKFSVLTVIF